MRLARCLVATTVAVALAVSALTPPAGASPRSDAARLMRLPLPAFLAAKAAAAPPFDWSDNGCTLAPDAPLGFDFRPACARHDFGYRNFGSGLRLEVTEHRRFLVDARFRVDLHDVCRHHRLLARRACDALAEAYYAAVRAFGAAAFAP